MRLSAQLAALLCIATLAACEQQQVAVGAGTGPGQTDPAAMQTAPDAPTALASDFETLAFGQSGRSPLQRIQAPLFLTAQGDETATEFRRQTGMLQIISNAFGSGAGLAFGTPRLDADGFPEIGPGQRGFNVIFSDAETMAEVLANDPAMRRAITAVGCGAMGIAGPRGEPFGALIIVDTSRSSPAQSYCINREIVANMGLAGFLSRTDSIFSDSVQVQNLSARDLQLVRMLYDPRLRHGMTAAQARPLLPAIAADALAR